MQPKQSVCLSLLALAAVAVAAPVRCPTPTRPLSNLQCNCLTFSPLSDPTQCSIPNAQDIDWQGARALAAKRDLRIQFASESTITKILAVEEPLPTSVLLRMSDGEPVLPEEDGANDIQDLIICGIGNEVKRRFLGEGDDDDNDNDDDVNDIQPLESDAYVGEIIALLLVLVLAYAAAESAWRR